MGRLKRSLVALARVTPVVKKLDWVGRMDDAQTVTGGLWDALKWLFLTGATVVAWIMGSPWIAFTVFVGVGLIILLFGPPVEEEWRERRRAKARKRKRLAGWDEFLPEMKQLAEALQAERLDREGEDIALLNRNRIALAAIVKVLDKRGGIAYPPIPGHGDTEEWETYLWHFVQLVELGKAHTLPKMYEELREAFARREARRDVANILRRFRDEDEGAE